MSPLTNYRPRQSNGFTYAPAGYEKDFSKGVHTIPSLRNVPPQRDNEYPILGSSGLASPSRMFGTRLPQPSIVGYGDDDTSFTNLCKLIVTYCTYT